MSEIEVSNKPKPFMTGTYALFRTEDGGVHVSYSTADSDETNHVQIPAMIFNMAMKMANGENFNPMSLFQVMRGK